MYPLVLQNLAFQVWMTPHAACLQFILWTACSPTSTTTSATASETTRLKLQGDMYIYITKNNRTPLYYTNIPTKRFFLEFGLPQQLQHLKHRQRWCYVIGGFQVEAPSQVLPSGKLTQPWKPWPIESSWIQPLKMVIFHNYVSLPEGKCFVSWFRLQNRSGFQLTNKYSGLQGPDLAHDSETSDFYGHFRNLNCRYLLCEGISPPNMAKNGTVPSFQGPENLTDVRFR